MTVIQRVKKLYNESVKGMLEEKERKSIPLQLFEMGKLSLKTGCFPQNYLRYKGYQKDKTVADVQAYLTGTQFGNLRNESINDARYSVLADDKHLFHLIMRDCGVPTANLLGVIQNKKINGSSIDEFFNSLDLNKFVLKPAIDSHQGQGVIVAEKLSKCKYKFQNDLYDSSAFLEKVISFFGNRTVLVEAFIEQHKSLKTFYSNSVNTIRIDTLKDKKGTVIFNSAYLRLGRNGRTVDNWSGYEGGIGVKINIDTGTLNEYGVDYKTDKYFEHPDSGLAFSNFRIPFWDEIKQTIEQASLAFTGLNSLGWDIAISEHGPVVVEVNQDYCPFAQQSCTGPFGNNPKFISALIDYAEHNTMAKKYIESLKAAIE